ncbi:F-box domain, cyclin-like protein [Artemisia annua]|uniref:F-box domain, cyclin-like protein n=1 Tax=Artemisia annua TaxID=35608 RepID=A0A2U1NZ14_ARTAN|nr:F-box domain, cyclin-like protein [Artemisia annua]
MKLKAIASESYYNYGYQDQAEDRLSSLPDALLVSILSYIDTKLAVQCSVLSKRWVNLWTLIPVLNLNLPGCYSGYKFNMFFSGRDGTLIKDDSVNLKVTYGPLVARVFDYALLHGVRNVSIDNSGCWHYTFPCNKSSDLLISLTLKGWIIFDKCLNFNGLVSLRLEGVFISRHEPFSSFPNLEELVLVNCQLFSNLDDFKVIGTQLSRLTISLCSDEPISYNKLVLLTPKLVLFDLKGPLPFSIKAFELPVLDTAHIDSFARDLVHNGPYILQQKLSLITVLRGLRHAINIHLSSSTLELLSQSHDMLVEEHFHFDNLKVLNLIPPTNKQPAADVYSSVAADLLKDCPQAVVKSLLSIVLSKRWVNLWPLIPVLNLDCETLIGQLYSIVLSKRWVNLWPLIPVLNLVLFELKGLWPMSFKALELPILDTVHINTFDWELLVQLVKLRNELLKSTQPVVFTLSRHNGPFAPWWCDDARGVLIGITQFTNKSHIARAVLESMCFQVKDLLDSMHKDAGEKGETKNAKGQFLLRVDGVATVNNTLMQIQHIVTETTALGAAYAAGLAVGVWTEEEIFSNGERMKKDTTFDTVLNDELREKKVDSWCKAVGKSLIWLIYLSRFLSLAFVVLICVKNLAYIQSIFVLRKISDETSYLTILPPKIHVWFFDPDKTIQAPSLFLNPLIQ